jgi:hypothetical protein
MPYQVTLLAQIPNLGPTAVSAKEQPITPVSVGEAVAAVAVTEQIVTPVASVEQPSPVVVVTESA